MVTPSRVDAALDRLDFRARVGQLNQRLFGWEAVERHGSGFRLSPAGRAELERWGGLGALYGMFRADAWSGRHWGNGIRPQERAEAAAAVQAEVRAAGGIGVLLSEEAPHGHQALGATLLPAPLSLAATWDPDLLREAAAAVAAQLAASGAHLALVSTLDLLRDPRWGRAEECYGEDPYLAALFTAAVVEGMQGPDRDAVGRGGVAVVLKHLAAQGEAVGGRNGQSAVIGPADLEELHLRAVRAGVDAGALGFMAAYNDIDGVPCCAHPGLLQGLLRDDAGFDGIVMADGLAVDRLAAMTGGIPAAGRAALLAGVDLSLWDGGFAALDSYADDPAVVAAVERSCRRVLELKDRFGLLDDAPASAPAPVLLDEVLLDEALQRGERLSIRLAGQSLVLLSDPGAVLPLAAAGLGRVLVAGPSADDVTALLGDYVPPLPTAVPGIAGALAAALPGATVDVVTTADDPRLPAGAAAADAVVLVLGGTSHRSYADAFAGNGALSGPAVASCGEGVDLASVELPAGQQELVARVVAAARGPVVAVVVAGRPYVLTPVLEHGAALVWAGYPGPHGGDAVARLLLGASAPTGRLPVTLPAHGGVVPVRHNDRQPAEGVYADAPRAVLFPFGHGLGYGDPPRVTAARATQRHDRVELEVTVALPGPPAGTPPGTVLPVFVHRTGGTVVPRLRELVDVLRLPAGAESVTLTRRLPLDRCRAPGATGPTTTLVLVGDHEITLALDEPGPTRPEPPITDHTVAGHTDTRHTKTPGTPTWQENPA